MTKININEEQFHQLIMEGVYQVLDEACEDENFKGFLGGLKGAFNGMKSGYQNGRIMTDTNNDNRWQYAQRDQFGNQYKEFNNEKDTIADVQKMYQLAKQYSDYANKLYGRAKAMEKYANLEKTGRGIEATFKYRDSAGQGLGAAANINNRRQAGNARYR